MRRLTICLVLALLVALVGFTPTGAFAWTKAYDSEFRTAHARFLKGVWNYGPGARGWLWLKAQAIAESGLDPRAVSPVGARGLTQFMPATSAEVARKLGIPDQPFKARWATLMQGYFMARLRAGWKSPRPEADRRNLALASYNAGPGHLYRAQKLARAAGLCDSNRWACIAAQLVNVTGVHSLETLGYVDKINEFHADLVAVNFKDAAGWLTAAVGFIGAMGTAGKWGVSIVRRALPDS